MVVVVGGLNIDLVVRVARLPLPGETILGSSVDRHPGGKGLNQAAAVARSGAEVLMVGALGSDDNAQWLREVMAAESIIDGCSSIASTPSGLALIEVDDAGQNRIVVVSGANGELSTQHMSESIRQNAEAGIVLTQLESPLDVISRGLKTAKHLGITTMLNPAPAPVDGLDDELLHACDILVPNETEASLLTGITVTDIDSATIAATQLLARGPNHVIVTMGAKGALWVSEGATELIAPLLVTPVDTTAAGDAFCGYLAGSLASGYTMKDALRRANAAGALTATRTGAVPSLPHTVEVAAILE